MIKIIDLENKQIMLEIKDLIHNINKINDDIDIYCDLMKQIFLSGSNKN